jgi:hypothetical protein
MGKLIGLALLVAVGVGVYYVGRSVEHQSRNTMTQVVALPSHAASAVAETNLAAAAVAASAYYNEHGSYSGLSPAALVALSPELPATIEVKQADATSFCLEDDLRGSVAHLAGPGGTATAGPCA